MVQGVADVVWLLFLYQSTNFFEILTPYRLIQAILLDYFCYTVLIIFIAQFYIVINS